MVRLAILASHEGTTLQALIDACAEQRLDAQLVAVISNNIASKILKKSPSAWGVLVGSSDDTLRIKSFPSLFGTLRANHKAVLLKAGLNLFVTSG